MPPNVETPSQYAPSSARFVPSLVCVAEEEPIAIAIRRITVLDATPGKSFVVEIPIFDVNIYKPEIPKTPLSGSYQRLLAEMEKYIGNHQNSEMYKEMAEDLRLKYAIKQAEARRLTNPNFTNRDWYWYSEQTRSFIDMPIACESEIKESNGDENTVLEAPTTSTDDILQENEDLFDLNADF
ncbi:unnamed protein product [Caenorhabditis brenneri]